MSGCIGLQIDKLNSYLLLKNNEKRECISVLFPFIMSSDKIMVLLDSPLLEGILLN